MINKQVTIPIFIPHLGCPHRCAFCNQVETSGSHTMPGKNDVHLKIEKYLATISKRVNRIEVAFFGGNFTGIEKEMQAELLNTANQYVKNGQIHNIRLSTRPDYITKSTLDLLQEFNVNTIELGVQSFSDDVLIASDRGHSSEDNLNAIKLIKSYKFNLIIQLMPGLPEDTFMKSIKTAEIAASHKPDGIRIYPTVVLNRTRLADMYYQKSYIPLTLEQAIDTCKGMYLIFNKENIPVIRLGLHPFTNDEIKNIISGPYHPSFGFLVKSRIKRDIIEKKIEDAINLIPDRPEQIEIIIPDKGKEEYIGNKKENIHFIKKRFNIKKVKYRVEEVTDLCINFSEQHF